jgi:hypothetical protein
MTDDIYRRRQSEPVEDLYALLSLRQAQTDKVYNLL